MDPMIRSYATSRRRRPRHGSARLLACSPPLPRSSPDPPLSSPSPPLQGLVGSPDPFERPGAPVTVPGQGGVAFDRGGDGTTAGAAGGGAAGGGAAGGGGAGGGGGGGSGGGGSGGRGSRGRRSGGRGRRRRRCGWRGGGGSCRGHCRRSCR